MICNCLVRSPELPELNVTSDTGGAITRLPSSMIFLPCLSHRGLSPVWQRGKHFNSCPFVSGFLFFVQSACHFLRHLLCFWVQGCFRSPQPVCTHRGCWHTYVCTFTHKYKCVCAQTWGWSHIWKRQCSKQSCRMSHCLAHTCRHIHNKTPFKSMTALGS